jgi:hypothetical protein
MPVYKSNPFYITVFLQLMLPINIYYTITFVVLTEKKHWYFQFMFITMQVISILNSQYGETIEDINTTFYSTTYYPNGKTKESRDCMYMYHTVCCIPAQQDPEGIFRGIFILFESLLYLSLVLDPYFVSCLYLALWTSSCVTRRFGCWPQRSTHMTRYKHTWHLCQKYCH